MYELLVLLVCLCKNTVFGENLIECISDKDIKFHAGSIRTAQVARQKRSAWVIFHMYYIAQAKCHYWQVQSGQLMGCS